MLRALSSRVSQGLARSVAVRKFSAAAVAVEAPAAPAAAEAEAAPAANLHEVIVNYGGYYPLLAMGSLVGIAKEWIIIDGTLLHGIIFPGAAMFIAVNVWDGAAESYHEAYVEEDKHMIEGVELYHDAAKLAVQTLETAQHQPDIIRTAYDEVFALSTGLNNYYQMTTKNDLRNATETKLKEVYEREQKQSKAAGAAEASGAVQHVRSVFAKSTPALRADAFAWALENLVTDGAAKGKNVVFEEFRAYKN